MKLKLLIALAMLVAMPAHADIKREDYTSYSAYLAAQSAQTAAEMEKELYPEPAPSSKPAPRAGKKEADLPSSTLAFRRVR